MVCHPRQSEEKREKRSIGRYRPYGADETPPRNRADGLQHRPLGSPELSFDLEDGVALRTHQIDFSARGPDSQAVASIQVRNTPCCSACPKPRGRSWRRARRDQPTGSDRVCPLRWSARCDCFPTLPKLRATKWCDYS